MGAAVLTGKEFAHITSVPSQTATPERLIKFVRQKQCQEHELYEFSLQQYVIIAGEPATDKCPKDCHHGQD